MMTNIRLYSYIWEFRCMKSELILISIKFKFHIYDPWCSSAQQPAVLIHLLVQLQRDHSNAALEPQLYFILMNFRIQSNSHSYPLTNQKGSVLYGYFCRHSVVVNQNNWGGLFFNGKVLRQRYGFDIYTVYFTVY